MAVDRPVRLQVVNVDIVFNFERYLKLEIDLQHINRGKNFTRNASFSIEDITALVTLMLNGETEEAQFEKEYENESCEYFKIIKNFNGKNFKLVFCICSDRLDALGIMTLYRLRR